MQQALARFERSWLWHGTSEDSIEKIIQQGFNRSFCGKNATVYGKGVYFARDASYSSHDTYSPPNSSGHKYILACSVVVGEFCRGKRDARTPDLRDAAKNILYDSTVDHPANASLYVTYHDAQAYPEYVIIYKERR
ncbi:ADP-ribosylation [Fragilariopsis cylindrus CCMP1102]|uniref:Poly [ADP-ribose] polymerase n=1 Tax=Fragilariopsis cylindrus CCMP1102 TaxID=635003 RepID=A0A1E7F520_9STRA|nr:ADP-ribosylation [Fragilariopsis cylindrus CCMP1102]|eukprot:OEU13282.1 ADP-ribosylation [Fragilariopsis cylindrus CCMP1102]